MDITSYLLGKKASGGEDALSEYFNTNPTTLGTSEYSKYWIDLYFIKKCPEVIIPDDISSVNSACRECKWNVVPKFIFGNNVRNTGYMFYNCSFVNEIDTSGFDISNVTDCSYMFSGCSNDNLTINTNGLKICNSNKMRNMFDSFKNTLLDLKDFYSSASGIDARQMFNACSNLQLLDMRSFDFTKISQTSNMFSSVPTECLIIVKDQTQKEWFTTNFASLTNVKTVDELQ